MFHKSYGWIRAGDMADTSLVDGVAANFELEESLERSARATDNSQYVYFVGDLASHVAEGYQAMLSAKVGLIEWNILLDALISGDGASVLTTATSASASLEKVQVAPVKTASAFGQLWATCPAKLAHVRELIAVLGCLNGGEFPSKVRDNPLFNSTQALKALALAMVVANIGTAEAQLKHPAGDLEKYTTHVYTAASWARFAVLDNAKQGWLKVHVGAANRQTTGVDGQAIDTIIRQQVRSC
jgi:diphthamide synthase (EF-2-diphthine--ammonia ligase)